MLSSGNNALPPSAAEEAKYRRKYKDLKRRVRDIEEDNDILNIKLVKAKVDIRRLRVERGLLQERLDDVQLEQRQQTRSSSTPSPRARPAPYHATTASNSTRTQVPMRTVRPQQPHPSQQYHQPPAPSRVSGNALLSVKERPSPLSTVGGASAKVGGARAAAGVPKKSTSNRRLRPRGPDAPRGPSNAFFIFSQMHRPEAKEICQGNSHYELARHLGQKWKNLTTEEKKKYVNLARDDRKRYLAELEIYDREHNTGPGATKTEPNDTDVDMRETPDVEEDEADVEDDEVEEGDEGEDDEDEEEDEDEAKIEADVDELMEDDDADDDDDADVVD
ncbi:non-histone protein 10 [Entomortierella parvispora]|uniref:Non-histone protein 10 n=1 Tax=Entomortierella parvispora TaxID=205924 RepID=A0A9P3HAY7_9FUNG|nr:non-histone protein 10 [Entomortierella parvispora]